MNLISFLIHSLQVFNNFMNKWRFEITQDLKSFWEKTYFEVRKELLSRYPKHHWPENPLTAEAMRGPKKRK